MRDINKIYNNVFTETELIDIRRDFHRHPEYDLELDRTQGKICEYLDDWGVKYRKTEGCGIIADFKGNRPGKNIGLRADMDALPVVEQNDFDYVSVVPGLMHACGHDIHMTVLLGAAKALASLKGDFPGFIRLIFQPAEEVSGGAELMIKEGCMVNPKLDHVFGLHVHPDYPVGVIGIKNDTACASINTMSITVHGSSAHAAMPEKGIDPIMITSHMIVAAQSVISRNICPHDSSLVTFGKITGGLTANQIPDSVTVEGTVRTLTPEIRQKTMESLERVCGGVVKGLGGTMDFVDYGGYAPLINDNPTAEKVRKIAAELIGKENVIFKKEPQMYGEDFAYYAQEVPSVFYHLGCKSAEGECGALHNSRFNPSEDCIAVGVKLQLAIALEMAES